MEVDIHEFKSFVFIDLAALFNCYLPWYLTMPKHFVQYMLVHTINCHNVSLH